MPARLIAAAAVAAVVVAGALLLLRGDDGPDAIARAEAYAAAWSRGDDAAAGRLTDAPGAATRALRSSRLGLDGASVAAGVTDITEDGDRARATVTASWDVPGFGKYAYDAPLELRKVKDAWVVHFKPQAVHPRLDAETRLGTVTLTPPRAPIVDRTGRALVGNRDVVDVAVQVDKVQDPRDTAARLAAALGDDVDARALAKAIAAAPRGRFLPVLTVRSAAFEPQRATVAAIPGVSLNNTTAPLAPTREFARAVLGTVGPVTAEQLKDEDRELAPGQLVGQSGLAAAFDAQLAGSPHRSVVIRDQLGDAIETLAEREGTTPKPLRTTLDLDVQRAAETALGGLEDNGALVALEASTGNILAVANRPGDSTYDRALSGTYPPGSTFKVVTTAALLGRGLDVDETVDCPATIAVGGRSFRNFEGSAAGAVPFRTDFAQSCNTAFISLADRLDPDTLTTTGRDFGLGRKLTPGVAVADASVPRPQDAAAQAAMMIGQDRILASPLSMAGVAATVAAGRWHAPRLLRDAARASGPELDAGALQTLRVLMRSVITNGTGTALAGVPGEPAGKSGTAEYGSGDPPPTHAWFIAYRDDLAVAVLVEGGSSGGRVAAPLAARFFAALDGG